MNNYILSLKEKYQNNLTILAHHYQKQEIVDLADKVGDSLELAQKIPELKTKYLIFAGVHFMAETAVILAQKHQKVFLPVPNASCVMANTAPYKKVKKILELLNEEKKVIPLAYVNSSASIKALCGEYGGSVCTSANAEKMLLWALEQADGVLFLPDKHLGLNTAQKINLPPSKITILNIKNKYSMQLDKNKTLFLWPGVCAVHFKYKVKHIEKARKSHPDAKVIVHPECSPQVVEQSDMAGSTSMLIKYVNSLPKKSKVYIGTEENLVQRLARKYKGQKEIFSLFPSFCSNMNKINLKTLEYLLKNLKNLAPVKVDEHIAKLSFKALSTMLKVCQ